jgi:TolB-like protein
MRPTIFLTCLSTLFFAARSQAALPITTIAGDPPTTAPAQQVSVMLLPFHAVTPNGENAWISSAIDEDLANDLSRNRAIRLVRPATTQPLAAPDELAAARGANAQRVVSGSYQVVEDQLRITADVRDPSQAQPIAEVKATGLVRDLFRLEDSLAMQLWHDLPQAPEQAPDQAAAADFQVTPLDDNVNVQGTAPAVVIDPPDVAAAPDVYPDSAIAPFDSAYPYADYGYGYPYGFGVPLFIGGAGYHGYHGGSFHGHYTGHVGGFVGAGSHAAPAVVHAAPSGFEAGGGHFVGGAHR